MTRTIETSFRASFRTPRPALLALLAAIAPLAPLAGCATEAAPEEPAPAAAPEEPADPAAPAASAVWEDLGPARFTGDAAASAASAASAADVASPAAPSLAQGPADAGPGIAIRAVDVRAGREYRVRIDRAELRAISEVARAAGVERGSLAVEADPPDRVLHDGWSDNHDSRIRYTATTSWPYRAIGTLFDGGGDCTGTRIGPRHVLTAAHCIYNRETASWNTINFKPGRNGAASAPYGSSGPHWYWVPDQYISGAPNLNGYDIGLIILDTPVGNGWIGYGAWSGGFLDDQSIFMRGYPRCNTEGAPAGCEPKTLWGDTKACGLGTFFDTDADGWNRQILTNCDGSAGQSGSSFYFYTADGTPATMGVFSHHYCLGGCPGTANDDYPNVITRITPTYLDVINWFRAEYP